MNKDTYTGNVTEEDIRDAERKYPLADISILKLVISMLTIMGILFALGVFIL